MNVNFRTENAQFPKILIGKYSILGIILRKPQPVFHSMFGYMRPLYTRFSVFFHHQPRAQDHAGWICSSVRASLVSSGKSLMRLSTIVFRRCFL